MNLLIRFLFGTIITAVLITPAYSKSVSYGVFVKDDAEFEAYSAFIDVMATRLKKEGVNKPLKVKRYSAQEELIQALAKGQVDFARLSPIGYISLKDSAPETEILAMETFKGSKKYKSVFIVHSESNIQKLNEIKGKTFAFGLKGTADGDLLAKNQLLKAKIKGADLKAYEHFNTEDEVAMAVIDKKFDAGVITSVGLRRYQKDDPLRVIRNFSNLNSPWVASPKLPSEFRLMLSDLLISLKDKDALRAINTNELTTGADSDYDFVRKQLKKAEAF